MRSVLIVGASAAGVTAAETLRKEGHSGEITLVGDEPDLPYDRPPLSKHVLSGAWDPAKAVLRDEPHYRALGIDLRLDQRAMWLDTTAGAAGFADGGTMPYDGLIIATGVRPRHIPGTDHMAGVFVLRTLADLRTLTECLSRANDVVVIGAGFLGLEVASVACSAGKRVTVVDSMHLPMLRPFQAPIGALMQNLHSSHGVTFRLNTSVAEFISGPSGVSAVELADGTLCGADVVVVAIGCVPNDDWLQSSELNIDDGIVCDEFSAAAPGIYAAGDVARWANPLFDTQMRLENRMNATEQGRTAAENLLGRRRPYRPVPYYWTHQFDLNLQAHGVFPHDSEFIVAQGSLDDDCRFLAFYAVNDRVVGVVGSRMAKQMRFARAAVQTRASIAESIAVTT